MRILFNHNKYRSCNSGEEASIRKWMDLLVHNGHEVDFIFEISENYKGLVSKLTSALQSFYAKRFEHELLKKVIDFQPDVVICQNVFPLISFSFIRRLKRLSIPLLLRAPNYRLFCPIGTFYSQNIGVCERCTTGSRELNCVLGNCRQNRIESSYYALRHFFNRVFWKPLINFDGIVVQTEFQKQKFISLGVEANKLFVIGGYSEYIQPENVTRGKYVSFFGRPTFEKGIETFLRLADEYPSLDFRVVGNADNLDIDKPNDELANVIFTGFLKGEELIQAYKNSSVVIVPSIWYEGFPNIIADAMKLGIPVLTSNLGAMTSIIVHDNNGLLANPNDLSSFKFQLDRLLKDDILRDDIVKNSIFHAQSHFTREKIYKNLEEVLSSISQNTALQD